MKPRPASPSQMLRGVGGLLALAASAFATAAAAGCGSPKGGPTDAPTASLYGAGAYPWAETMLPWKCVYNVLDFPAPSAGASFYLAQAAAVANGGGVVYFPAGEYAFTANLFLNSSVAVRGAPTTALAKVGKRPGPLAPATRFTFVDRAHFGILNIDPAAKALAVVNVAIEFGSIMLWPGLAPAPPSVQALPWPAALKSYWYGATAVVGAGSGKLVLSNTVRSVAFGATDPTNPSTSNPWAYRFSHAIAVYADADSLVANNLLPPSPAGPRVTLHLKGDKNASESQPFPYDNRYGIDNKLLYGAVAGSAVGAGGACGGKGWGTLEPTCAPYMFPRSASVVGNYVFNCGRVAFNLASGCAGASPELGAGLQVIDNHSEHCDGSTCWTVDGVDIARGSDTNENRNIDISGYCASIVNNSAHVFRQYVPGSKYMTVDGECVLAQTEANSFALAHRWTGNDCTHPAGSSALASGPIFFYKMVDVEGSVVTGNANDAGQYMGAVFDATHDGWKNNSCKGNSQPCKCGSAACPAPAALAV